MNTVYFGRIHQLLLPAPSPLHALFLFHVTHGGQLVRPVYMHMGVGLSTRARATYRGPHP